MMGRSSSASNFNVVVSKICGALLLIAVSLVGAIIPFLRKESFIPGLLSSFAAGAFLSLSICHVLPDALEALTEAGISVKLGGGSYNATFPFVCLGYMIILICEKVLSDHNEEPSKDCRSYAQTTQIDDIVEGRKSIIINDLKQKPWTDESEKKENVEEDYGVMEHKKKKTIAEAEIDDPRGDIFVNVEEYTQDNDENSSNKTDRNEVTNLLQHAEDENISSGMREDGKNEKNESFAKKKRRSSIFENFDVKKVMKNACDLGEFCAVYYDNSILASEIHTSRFPLSAVFLMIALTIHGIFEGMIVGVSGDLTICWILIGTIVAHKWAESLMLMNTLLEKKTSKCASLILLATFIFSSPLGIVVGLVMIVSTHSSIALKISGIANAVGAGTFLFFATEMVMESFNGNLRSRFLQFFFYSCGLVLIFLLTLVETQYESEVE